MLEVVSTDPASKGRIMNTMNSSTISISLQFHCNMMSPVFASTFSFTSKGDCGAAVAIIIYYVCKGQISA